MNVSSVSGTTWSHDDTANPHSSDFTYQLQIVDNAANVGATASQDVEIDTGVASNTITISAITHDTGAANDFKTSDTELLVNGTLASALQSDETLQISTDGGTTWVNVSSVSGTTWSHDDTANPHSSDFTYQLQIVDNAANVGATASQDVEIDTGVASNTITISAITHDTGAANDFKTSDTELLVNGTLASALQSDETLQISTDGGTTWVNVSSVSGTTWSHDDTANPHSSDFTYQLQIVDNAANVGATASQDVEIDTGVASNTITISAITHDTGAANDFKTSDTELLVNGTLASALQSDETLQISTDGGTTWVNVSSVSGTTWSHDDTANPHSSDFTYQLQIVDNAANVGATASQDIVINIPPTSSNSTATANEDTSKIFGVSDFVFDDLDGDDLDHITITSVTGFGLTLSGTGTGTGTALKEGDEIAAADLGLLSYNPTPEHISGNNLASFEFTVSDGTNDSANSYTMTMNVTPVADMPSLTVTGTSTAVVTSGLFGQWLFDENTGLTTDNEASSRQGGLNGDVAWEASGHTGSAVSFDGDGDYISVDAGATDVPLYETATLSIWIKVPVDHGSISSLGWDAPSIIGTESAEDGNDIQWGWIDTSGHLNITAGSDNGARSDQSIADDAWHHVVITRDHVTGETSMIIDGVLNDTDISETGNKNDGYSGWDFGRTTDESGSHRFFTGSMDDARIYDRVLTTQEAWEIYQVEKAIASNSYDLIVKEGEFIDFTIDSALIDVDGSETLMVEITGIPAGVTIQDGSNSFTSDAVTDSVDITGWDIDLQVRAFIDGETADLNMTVVATVTDFAGGITDTVSKDAELDVFVYSLTEVVATPNEYTGLQDSPVSGNLMTDAIDDYDTNPSAGPVKNQTGDPALALNYDAGEDSDGNTLWESAPDSFVNDLTLSASSSYENVTSRYEGITQAFRFDGAGGLGASGAIGNSLDGFSTNNDAKSDASFEIWFKSEAGHESEVNVLFETGGKIDGTSLTIKGTVLEFRVQDNGNSDDTTDSQKEALLSFDLDKLGIDPTEEFVQVTGVVDINSGQPSSVFKLYVNGTLVTETTNALILDWAGGNQLGLGTIANTSNLYESTTGDLATNFEGDIAEFRFYNKALSNTDVLDNFKSVSGLFVSQVTQDMEVYNGPFNFNTPIALDNGSLVIAADGSYVFTPNSGFIGTETFSYTISDLDNNTDTAQVTINIADPASFAPGISGLTGAGYIEGASEPAALINNLQISDGQNDNLSKVVVKLADYNSSEDDLSWLSAGTSIIAVAEEVSGEWVLTLTGGSSIAEYLTVLESIRYSNSSQDPSSTPRVITVLGYDESFVELETSITSTLTITPVNDNPVANDHSISQTTDATVDIGFQAPTDVDSVDSDLTVQLTSLPDPSNGKVTFSDGSSLVSLNTPMNVADFQGLKYVSTGNTGTFIVNYSVDDDSGGTDSGSLTVVVGNAEDDTGTVFESALQTGTQIDDGSTLASGNLLDNDGAADAETIVTSVSYTGTGSATTSANDDITTITTPHGVLTVYTDNSTSGFSAGDYSYQLNAAVENALNESSVVESFSYTINTIPEHTASLNITIEDDEPIAVNIIENAPESAEEVFNLVLGLDVSTSMGESVGNSTRFELAKEALIELVTEYFNQSTQVSVTLMVFANGSYEINNDPASVALRTDDGAVGESFTDLQSFINVISDSDIVHFAPYSGITNSTNYKSAVDGFRTILDSDLVTQPSDTQNITYFLSDGAANLGTVTDQDNDPSDNVQRDWREYAKEHNIDSYSVGIGSELPPNLDDLNFVHNIDGFGQGSAHIDKALVVENLNNLSEVLLSSVPTAFGGSVVSDGGIVHSVLGADGGYIQSITIDLETTPVTFEYDNSTVTPTSGAYEISGSILKLDESVGFPFGTMLFDFSNGNYKFFAKAGTAGQQAEIKFFLIDKDGDVASNDLTLNITEAVPDARDDLHTFNSGETVQGNVISGLGADGGITLGSQFTDFAVQGGGVDSAVDSADISSIVVDGITIEFESGTVTGTNGDYTVSAITSEIVKGITVYQVTVTNTLYNSSIIFRTNGYYNYVSGTQVIPMVVSYVLSDTEDDSDTATLTIRAIENTVSGNINDETIDGTSQNDSINGLAGNDVIHGNDGYDNLSGGEGNDIVYGGSNDDRMAGGTGNDELYGESGSDVLQGGEGEDVLDGGIGDDLLEGGNDNDQLFGYFGQDVLIGGRGDDTMTGGRDSDTFVFRLEDMLDGQLIQTDTITDFVLGDPVSSEADIIDLAELLNYTGDLSSFDNNELLALYKTLGITVKDIDSDSATLIYTRHTTDGQNDQLKIVVDTTTDWQNQNPSDSTVDGDDVLLQLIGNGQIIV